VIAEDNKTSSIIIRNIDNHLYYVEWIDNSTDNKPQRLIGYTAQINGATFANLRGLTDDGSIETKYTVMRISLSADQKKLTLRNLSEDFFKNKTIDSSEAFEKIVAENVENEKMYDGAPAIATRLTASDTNTNQPGHTLP
jgi:hypothetical protein